MKKFERNFQNGIMNLLKISQKLQFLNKFEQKVSKCTTPEAEKLDRLLQNFKRKDKHKKLKEKIDVREELDSDIYLSKMSFVELRNLYHIDSNELPIKEQIPFDRDIHQGMNYRYAYIPRLLNGLCNWVKVIKNINWPPISLQPASVGSLHDIFNPKEIYTWENIKDALWLSCWIGAYWYHENSEKRIHITQLLLQLPSMKFSSRQRELILSQIVDNIEMYGKPSVAAENLSYLIHCIKTIPGYNIDWRHQNQLMLCFHKLALGWGLKINITEFEEKSFKKKKSSFSSNFSMTQYHFKLATEVCKKPNFDRLSKHGVAKSISLPQYLSTDFIGNKIKKAASIVERREVVNKIRNTSSKNISRK